MTGDTSSEICKPEENAAKRKKKSQLRILYLEKISFKNEGRIVADKQKLEDFLARRPHYKRILKAEGKMMLGGSKKLIQKMKGSKNGKCVSKYKKV